MKRSDVWMALVGGCVMGLVVGFLAAYTILDDAPASVARARPISDPDPAPSGTPSEVGVDAEPELQNGGERLRGNKVQKAVVNSLRMPRPLDQAQLLAVIQNLRKEDFPEVLEVLRNAKTGIHTSSLDSQGPLAWIAFWQRFGELDPRAAIATALQCADLNYADRHLLEKHLFTGMARSDPLLAAKLFLEHPELPNRAEAGSGLVFAWSAIDPNAALKWARENLDGPEFMRVTYAATWGAANAQSEYPEVMRAITVAKAIPEAFQEPALRAVKDMVYKRAYISTDDTLAAVSFTREIGKRDTVFENTVIRKLVRSDPDATANYFAQPLANGSANIPQISLVATMWAQQDFNAAETWANGQRDASHFQDIAKILAEAAVKRGDDEAARRWNGTVKSGEGTPASGN